MQPSLSVKTGGALTAIPPVSPGKPGGESVGAGRSLLRLNCATCTISPLRSDMERQARKRPTWFGSEAQLTPPPRRAQCSDLCGVVKPKERAANPKAQPP